MIRLKSLPLLCTLVFCSLAYGQSPKTPRMTVIIVIDQFAYSYLYKIRPFLTGGLKTLLENGISYENAHHAHAMPETAVGHAALNTGTFASDHGIIANSWFDQKSKAVEADDDDPRTAAVFKDSTHVHTYGKGPKLLMTEGISDQFALQSQPSEPHLAFAFSIKSRAAIMCAGRLGKAVWFDKETGLFTSSKAYYKTLPAWLEDFNKQKRVAAIKTIRWNLTRDQSSGAYNFSNIANYAFSSEQESMIGKTFTIDHTASKATRAPGTVDQEEHSHIGDRFAPFYLNPLSNKYLLDLARKCIKEYLTKQNRLLLWISLSSLDLIGHRYGPDSLEAIDTLYYIDKQLKPFIMYANQATGNNTLFVLTADHGILPMQGVLEQEGLDTAKKFEPSEIIAAMNNLIQEKHDIPNFISNFQMPQFYFNPKAIKRLDKQTMQAIIKELKEFLHATPEVKNVWTNHDLDVFSFSPFQDEIEFYFKSQRYPGRSGDLFIQLQPYTLLSHYKKGTTHESPYNYDTHVPLVLYYPGVYESESIVEKVYATQLANTLAQIVGIERPPASTAKLLPGVFEKRTKIFKKKNVFITPSALKKQQAAKLV